MKLVIQNKRKWFIIGTITFLILGTGIGLLIYFLTRVKRCPALSKKKILDYSDALSCYRDSVFYPNEAKAIIKTMREQMQLYSIVDFLKENSDPHFDQKIDVDLDLEEIGSRKYDSDFDFHYALSKYFKTLQEGHTGYDSAKYSIFRFELPISLIPYHEDNRIILKVIDYKPQMTISKEWERRGFLLSKYIDDTVLEIEGMSAMKYIQKHADEFIGISRDPSSRVRRALARTTEFSPTLKTTVGEFTKHFIPPNKGSITVTFKNNGKVSIPYLAINSIYYPELYTEGDSYNIPGRFFSELTQEIVQSLPRERQIPSLFLGEFIKMYLVEDAVVMYIPRFPVDKESIEKWDKELFESFIELEKSGISKILFDMSNNPGGLVNAAYDLLKLFFPAARRKPFDSYLTNKPPLKELGKKLKLASKIWSDIPDRSKKPIENLVKSIDNYADTSNSRIPYSSEWLIEENIESLMMDSPLIPLDSMALMSNSVCSSACALFSNWIQEMTNVPTYHVGNFISQRATIGTCIGGSKFEISDGLFPDSKSILALDKLPADSQLSFSLIGFYSLSKPKQSLDFTWLPAKYNINTTELDINDPLPVWSRIIQRIN